MQRERTALLSLLLMLVGLLILCYPTIGTFINGFTQTRAIVNYCDRVDELTAAEKAALWQAAENYNAALRQNPAAFDEPNMIPGYKDCLDPEKTGIMGYVDIPKLRLKLPIYHGTSAPVLQIGAGHLAGSALPTGGLGNHTVISAHSGLPTARLFTDLPKLKKGDDFCLHVLDKKLTYRVIQIQKVTPKHSESLRCQPGKDYCTLFTCTPYGINTHRLLVTGERLPDQAAGVKDKKAGLEWPPWLTGYLKLGAAFAALAANIILIIKQVYLLQGQKRGGLQHGKGGYGEKTE